MSHRSAPPSSIFVLGRFPPPIDGQAVATERLAGLLAGAAEVRRLNLSPPDSGFVEAKVALRTGKVGHYLQRFRRSRAALATDPTAPVLWTSISPSLLGHVRDLLTTVPAFAPHQPVYGVVHWGSFDRLFTSPITAWSGRWLVRRLAGLIFLSERLAERCAPWVPFAKRHVVPNTLGEDLWFGEEEVRRKQERGPHRPFRLLFLSNMIPSKGYLDVLDAVRRLIERGVPVTATFAGGWQSEAERRDFERRVAVARLGGHVTHLGAVRDRRRVRTLYLEADAFVLPTYYPTEAQPLSIIEALAAGTPIISTAHAGIPDMVRAGEEALFVSPRAPGAIAEAVETLRDPSTWRRLAEGALARFAEEFSPEAVRARWLALLATT